MNLYVETSAVMAWLLGEERGETVRAQLAAADVIFTSDLTLIECDRAFRRAVATGRVTASEALQIQASIDTASSHWTLLGMDADIVHRSRRSFPREAIRALDAIHLATALAVRDLSPDMVVLSLDDRIRDNAVSLSFEVAPVAEVSS